MSEQVVAQPPTDELSMAAASARQFARQLRDGHAPWNEALSVPCPRGHAPLGRWCWFPPASMCSERVSAGARHAARMAAQGRGVAP